MIESRSASGVRAWPEFEREQIEAAASQAEALGLALFKSVWQQLAADASAKHILQTAHVMQLARQSQQQWPVFEIENVTTGESNDGNSEEA